MIRKFIEFAIDKALLNHMFLLFIFITAIFSYIKIPKEIFPPISMDKVIITGGYSGTSANVLDKMVVGTIEDDLKNISELQEIKTEIQNGSFQIQAEIKKGSENINVLNDVKDVIATVKKDIPADMNEPIAKLVVHKIPLALIAVSGDVSTSVLLERAEELKSALSRFKELSDLEIRGDADEELVIRLDEERIKAYNLRYQDVVSALENLSSIFPVGTIKEKGSHLYISTYNGEKDPDKLIDMRLNVNGKLVRLGDVAQVAFELSDETELSHYNGKRNVSLNINKSEDGNAIALVKEIRKELELFRKKYPDIGFDIYTDTSIWIKNRLNTVFSNIIFGLILVFFSLFIFVNRGIALVVGMGIPVSFMIGLIFTELIGYSLNMLSLLGALIALGMLVDEAIVVAENIYRHLEEGMERREATIRGAVEMFPAVLTATATTVFAFLPLLLISGEMGEFIKILPVMISVLLISSLFEAFYFLPLHAHEFLRLRKETHLTHYIWEHQYRWYNNVLHFLFKRKIISLTVIVSTILVCTFILASQSKFQLFPQFDNTQVYITGKVNINNDLENTELMVTEIEKTLLKQFDKDELESLTSVIGIKMNSKNEAVIGENLFTVFVQLHEKAPSNVFDKYISPYLSLEYDASKLKRERLAKDINKDIIAWLKPYKEQKDTHGVLMFEELSSVVPGAGVVAYDIEVALGGKSDEAMREGIVKLENTLSHIDGVLTTFNDAELGEKELKLRVNSYGQRLGFNERIIGNELRSYYLKGEYGKMFKQSGLVRIKLEGSLRDTVDSIETFQVQIPGSESYIALKDVCDFIVTQAYVKIKKEDAERQRTVFGVLEKGKVTADEVMAQLDPTLESLRTEGFKVFVKGEAQENAKTKREMMQSAIVAILLIFITLVWLFDSFLKSLIVLSTIPLVFLGVLLGHIVMDLNLTMPGMIGFIGLAGVVVNDGLIMVSFIRDARDSETLMQKAKTRLRPILMTSITTVLGLSTLIFFASGQAQILQPMAVSLGFGLAWATFLNLVYVPLLYAVIYRIKRT